MYYRLKSTYALRGWDKMAWALVQRPGNKVRTLKREEFQTLLLCDGTTDFEMEFISDEMRMLLQNYIDENIVEVCTNGEVLEEDQYYQYYDNRYVKYIFWSITGHCNFRCRHCYMDAPHAAMGELSYEDASKFIDQMAECGVLQVDITGGEPFVRKDFWKLVDRILEYKMTIGQIHTNGWLLTDEVLGNLEKRGLRPAFSISFDGINWHDWMRGIEGAEQAALRALRLCIERGFPVNVEMCVHKGNQDTLRDTVKLLASIGVPFMKCGFVAETDLWRENSEGNDMDVKAFTEAMIDYIPYFYEDGMPMEVLLGGVISLRKGSTKYEVVAEAYNGTEECINCHLCRAARYACYITPEGRLLPCMPMTACKEQESFPCVQDIGLKKGLSESFYMNIVNSRIKDLLEVNPVCNACNYKYQCGGGCRAIALEQTGDLMGCDSHQCLLWKEGYVDRIREVAEAAIAKYCTDHTEVHPNT